MSPSNGGDDLALQPAARNYLVVCLAALAVVLLVLLRQGFGGWSFLPVLIGLGGAMLQWRPAALLSLIVLSGLLFVQEAYPVRDGYSRRLGPAAAQGFGWAGWISLPDWILCGAVLAYMAAHYRLLGLTRAILPAERTYREEPADKPGDRGRPAAGGGRLARAPHLVGPAELGWVLLALPLWASLAQLAWRLLPRMLPEGLRIIGLQRGLSQGILLAWFMGLGVLATAGLLAHIGRRRLSRPQALLLMQDILWQATGREQRRLNSWLAWARRRRKEGP